MSSEDMKNASSEHLAIAEASNHLAIKLYKLLTEKDRNLFISPFSVSTALAMLYCGCKSETAEEMRSPLGYELAKLENEDIESSFLKLLNCIEEKKEGYTLACANSVVCDKAFSVKNAYKTLLEESFKAVSMEVDFKSESEEAVEQINEWVKGKTNGMIPKLLSPLSPNTVMVLLNAIYFKGLWLNQFLEKHTFMQYFYNNGVEDDAKLVEMMHLKEKFPFLQQESFKALQLPYKGKDMSMLILLPNARDGLASLEESLSSSFVLDLLQKMHETKVEVAFPKFRMEYSKSLVEQFQLMGVEKIFEAGVADFGGIHDSKDLYISDIVHKAVIEVNEEGSEAAAATAVVMALRCLTFVPEFIVDHPFIFTILSPQNNLIYFMGRVEEL